MNVRTVLPRDAIPSIDDPTVADGNFGDPDDGLVFTAGGGIHAFEDPSFEYDRWGDGGVADGTAWDAVTGESADGRALARVPGRWQFAFAWQDGRGPSAFY